jgi:hypothetical protein
LQRTGEAMKKYFLLVVLATFSILSHAQLTWFHQSATQEVFNLHVQTCQNNAQLTVARQQAPQISEQQQYERDLNRGIALAQLDPGAAARASLQAGIGQIGRGIAGSMNIQDPQTQRYTQLLFNQCMFGFGYQLKN